MLYGARAGKRLLVEKLQADGEDKGAAYFKKEWQQKVFTYAEVNHRLPHEPEDLVQAHMATQSNAIERENLDQKSVRLPAPPAPRSPYPSCC